MSDNLALTIDGVKISQDATPYVIAELSANHNGSIETALKLIFEAKKAGASAIKLQTYTADTLTLNSTKEDFQINDGLWKGKTLYELYQNAYLPWEWHEELFNYAKKIGITIFSSPFDQSAVDFLENLNAPAYKIASFEAVDLPLIKYVAATKKPLIISTGMANEEEIQEAIGTAKENGCTELAVLHCVSGYPAPAEDYNLKTLVDMRDKFGVVTGLSDHTLGNATAIASVALGGAIIEKHFTLDRSFGGPDDSFSLEPKELQALCADAKAAWSAIGTVNYGRKSSEQGNVKFRRSLYYVNDILEGDIINKEDIKSVRPGYGLPPKCFDEIVGKKTLKSLKKNTPVKRDDLDYG